MNPVRKETSIKKKKKRNIATNMEEEIKAHNRHLSFLQRKRLLVVVVAAAAELEHLSMRLGREENNEWERKKKKRERELECITHHRLSKQTSTVSDIIFSTRREFSLVCRRRRLMFEEFRLFTHRPRDIRWTKFIVNVKRVGFACSRGWRRCETSFDRLISWNRFQQFIIASNRCWLILIDWFIS